MEIREHVRLDLHASKVHFCPLLSRDTHTVDKLSPSTRESAWYVEVRIRQYSSSALCNHIIILRRLFVKAIRLSDAITSSNLHGHERRWKPAAILRVKQCYFRVSLVSLYDETPLHKWWWAFLFDTPPLLPARRYASAGYRDRNVSVRLSVCPSVCPSRAGIVSKRRKLASWFLHHLVAPRL